MEQERTAECTTCRRKIYPATARATGGICRPCLLASARSAAEEHVALEASDTLTNDEFELIRTTANLEAACHLVFDKAHTKWIRCGYDALTTGERTIIAVETFFGEVCSGGLIQFLGNEAGAFAHDLPEALLRVGLTRYAPIAVAMRRTFSNTISRDPSERWQQVESLEEREPQILDQLTEKFFEIHSHDDCQEDFRERVASYIRLNRAEFVPEPAA